MLIEEVLYWDEKVDYPSDLTVRELARALLIAIDALEEIKDGGVPNGVVADSVERHLAMNRISIDALEKIEAGFK
jgi:hypothetical protein